MCQAYRSTSPGEKLLNSTINAVVALVFSLPVFFFSLSVVQLKLAVVAVFFLENLEAILFHSYRLPGMRVLGTRWKAPYSTIQQLVHALLYSLSFASLLFWVWFPGDLLIINLLCLQLPCVLTTGTTLHGLLAGKMVDVKTLGEGPPNRDRC